MTRFPTRASLTACIALAVGLSGLAAAPARAADPEDIARLLGGAATLFIIGKAIQSARADDDRDDRRGARYRDWRDRRDDDRRHDGRGAARHGGRDDWRGGRGAARQLPAACFARGEVRGLGTARVFGAQCLDRRYRFADRLPQACRVHARTARGRGPAYDAGCLRRYGYRLDRG